MSSRPPSTRTLPIERLVSGGQTGVDRATLDVALELGIPCGGWCPRGRRAEDGSIDARYPLVETPGRDYRQRTAWNVRDTEGTLILVRGVATGGTAFTLQCVQRARKPHRVVNLAERPDREALRVWLAENAVHTLNIAGPRESERPGVYGEARRLLLALLA